MIRVFKPQSQRGNPKLIQSTHREIIKKILQICTPKHDDQETVFRRFLEGQVTFKTYYDKFVSGEIMTEVSS